ncbi:MAG: hypothetical protein NTW21_31130 [Verrucomicrobia bacterium]|nr:hypothetical protein [Verrucomicrobiota bacterium]
MNLRYFPIFGAVSALVAVGTMPGPAAALAQSTAVADVQILTRGPVHEAFAETVSFDPQPGLIVRAEPPAPIEELPPEQQPVGDNVTWIPGYWAWDDEQTDFLWISGIWRNLPPGRQWRPGYWSGIGDGQFQWTSGYWADAASTAVTYLATAPPRNLDVGPNIAAASDDQSWIPGNWVWAENRYLWRPGYWLPLRTDWNWVPSRYCWSRRGYVYVDGYWDYAVANRGVLFAPVYFNRHVYDSPDYYYTPGIVIALDVFADHLFVRPRCGHYYFGDYYASRYRGDGYYASCSRDAGYRGYDPIYAYDRWQHRGDQGWESRRRADFDFFRDHEDVRPRHTWAAMQEADKNRDHDGRNRMFASTLDSIAKTPAEGPRFRPLDQDRREQFVAQSREIRKFGQARHQVEASGRDAGAGSNKLVARESLTRSPVIGRQTDRFASREAPPQRPEARGTDIRIDPATKAGSRPGVARTGDTRIPAGRQSSATGKMDERAPAVGTAQSRPAPKASSSVANRDGSDPNAIRQVPGRQANAGVPRPQQPTPRQIPGTKTENSRQPEMQVMPQRQVQPTPQRQVQPQPQIRQAPQRQVQPTPQRQVQPQPQLRQAPQRQVQPTPQRQVQPQPQIRQAPQRQVQPTPQRQVQPQPQIRQAPQRQVQPTLQRQVQPGSQSPATDGRENKRDRSR